MHLTLTDRTFDHADGNPDHYVAMLDRAKEGGFAYPAINVTSSQTLIAALQGFAEAESDGIVQVSLGTALYLSGNAVQNRFAGSKARTTAPRHHSDRMAE
jgi:fructose-bisphosphate aldolase, class II